MYGLGDQSSRHKTCPAEPSSGCSNTLATALWTWTACYRSFEALQDVQAARHVNMWQPTVATNDNLLVE